MISPSDLIQLPVEERLKCMEILWDSLCSEEPVSPDWHEEGRRKIENGEAEWIREELGSREGK